MKKPDAILFDWDGTLIDGFEVIFNGYNAALIHFGLPPMTEEQARANVRLSTRDVFPKVFGDNAQAAQKIYYDYVTAHHLKHIKMIEGSSELLAMLQAAGIPVGIVSNKTHYLLEREVELMGWRDVFSSVIGAGFAARDKPAPDPLIQAAANMNLSNKTSELWYVGDTETDMQAAHAAGFTPVFIEHGIGQIEQLKQWPPQLIVADHQGLISAIRALV